MGKRSGFDAEPKIPPFGLYLSRKHAMTRDQLSRALEILVQRPAINEGCYAVAPSGNREKPFILFLSQGSERYLKGVLANEYAEQRAAAAGSNQPT